jgi:putative zinc finger/helix-turn-helix YgiT family protein
MKIPELFGYTCPECGRGIVRTTRVLNYKTKIKGYPFVVDEAFIGVCDQCKAESFAPEETKRWEELFYRSLEAHQAFLSPEEITQLRTDLSLSMEDFARLIGCTRQSLSSWEKRNRTSAPSRMADLLMKLVRQSLYTGPVKEGSRTSVYILTFAGSNTTGAAAEHLGRKWIAFEIDRVSLAASALCKPLWRNPPLVSPPPG